MKTFAALLAALLAGCSAAPFKVFMGEYTKPGVTDAELSSDRNACSREALDVFNNTAARGQVASYIMQRHMYECMKQRGYEAPNIHPDAYKQTLSMGRK